MKTQSKRPRKYTGVMQYFHNFEHDPEGLNHCHSIGEYPYTIEHKDGKHIISAPIARGHGRGCEPQWFRFTERANGGYDMASGVKIDKPPQPRREKETMSLSPKPRIEEAQSEYKKLMKPRLEAHDKEIKAVNDKFMAGEITPREMEQEHKKIHAKTDAVAATMRKRVWGKYAETLPSRTELEKVQRMRTPRSQASDLARKHSVVISPDSPRVATWLHDQGTADITGIDTPRAKTLRRKGTPRITPPTPRLRR